MSIKLYKLLLNQSSALRLCRSGPHETAAEVMTSRRYYKHVYYYIIILLDRSVTDDKRHFTAVTSSFCVVVAATWFGVAVASIVA